MNISGALRVFDCKMMLSHSCTRSARFSFVWLQRTVQSSTHIKIIINAEHKLMTDSKCVRRRTTSTQSSRTLFTQHCRLIGQESRCFSCELMQPEELYLSGSIVSLLIHQQVRHVWGFYFNICSQLLITSDKYWILNLELKRVPSSVYNYVYVV